jgi:hypothetical protein
MGLKGSGRCIVFHGYIQLARSDLGKSRNPSGLRVSDARFECKSSEYEAGALTITPKRFMDGAGENLVTINLQLLAWYNQMQATGSVWHHRMD